MGRLAAGFAVMVVIFPALAWSQGMPAGPEFRVNTYTTSGQRAPAVAVDGTANFVVVWTSAGQDGSYDGIFGQRYDSSGAPLGSEFRINSFTTGYQSSPSVSASLSGEFVVVWDSVGEDGSGRGVFGQRFDNAGAPLGSEFRVNTYTSNAQYNPSVASDSAGNFVVAWQSYTQDGSLSGVYAQRFGGAGNPLGAEFRVNTYTTGYQFFPSIAADAAGNFVVSWTDTVQDGNASAVFAQRFASSGAPLGGEFRVNTFTTGYQYRSAVAEDPSGNFVVVGMSGGQDGSSVGVFGQRYASSGSPLGPEFRVNTFTTNRQDFPSVASDSGGNFVVVWRSDLEDGASYGVFGQRYSSAGAPVGSEFRVNTYTTSYQDEPAVGVAPSGEFVVVWESYPQDGFAFGIFAQRYTPIVPLELTGFTVE
jgi:hypothetical protein